MSIDALVAPLLRVRLFQGLEPIQIAAIARSAERVLYRDGTVIVEAGQSGDAAIILVAGPAESFGTMPGERDMVIPGSIIGEMGMFIDHVFATTVVARGAVKALRLTRDAMHQLMLEDQGLAEFLVAKISERLSVVADELRRIDEAVAAPFAQGSLSAAFDALPPPIALPHPDAMSLGVH